MNKYSTQTLDSALRKSNFSIAIFVVAILAVASISFWAISREFGSKNKYAAKIRIDALAESVIHAQGRIRLEESGDNPIQLHKEADEAYEKLRVAVSTASPEDVSFRARELVRNGPTVAVEVTEEGRNHYRATPPYSGVGVR